MTIFSSVGIPMLIDPCTLPQAAWAVATIGLLPPSSWMGALVRATQANMSALQPQQGVHLIWAMYRTNHAPPRQYIDALLEQVIDFDCLQLLLIVCADFVRPVARGSCPALHTLCPAQLLHYRACLPRPGRLYRHESMCHFRSRRSPPHCPPAPPNLW